MSRGFPQTHCFAQAGVDFAVARSRCEEVFNHPDATTIWNLSGNVEYQFDFRWGHWLAKLDSWRDLFNALALPQTDLLNTLRQFDLLSPSSGCCPIL